MLSSQVEASSSVVPRSWGASRRLAAAPMSLWQLGDKQLGDEQLGDKQLGDEQATGGGAHVPVAVGGQGSA